MLSKLTLNFLYPEQQENYMIRNSEKIIKEHFNFTLYALTFALINMVQFIIQESVAYSILAASSCILIIILYKFISLKPNYINYVITFYQFYVLFIIEINNILSNQDRASQTFAWSYGYQTGFMHFTLYLQGTNMIGSTLILMIVTFTHISFFTFDPVYSFTNIFSFVFMFISQIGVKYNCERRKKEEFFYSYQQEQWEQIIRKSISNTMILIRYDRKQDQLRLVKQSIKSKYLIKNCYDMRQFLRNLVEMIPGQKTSCNLEQLVRQNLIQHEKYNPKLLENKHFIDQLNRVIYKVKLNKFILNNELQCLLILDKIQIPDKNFQDIQILLFSELSLLVSRQMQVALQTQKGIKQLSQHFIKENYYTQTTLFFIQILTSNISIIRQQEINQQKLSSTLQQMLGTICQVNCPFVFYHQFKYIISIIVSCSQLIQYMNKQILPKFIIMFRKNLDSQIQMTLIFPMNDSDKQITNLLMANWFGNSRKKFSPQSLYQNCIDRLCLLKSQYNFPVILLFNICVMQIIMSQICLFNHFKVESQNSSLELTCTFQN